MTYSKGTRTAVHTQAGFLPPRAHAHMGIAPTDGTRTHQQHVCLQDVCIPASPQPDLAMGVTRAQNLCTTGGWNAAISEVVRGRQVRPDQSDGRHQSSKLAPWHCPAGCMQHSTGLACTSPHIIKRLLFFLRVCRVANSFFLPQ